MISTVQDQQPWHADSQNRQPALILTDSSCITETMLFERVFEGSGLREPGLHLWCDFLDSLHIVCVGAYQCNM